MDNICHVSTPHKAHSKTSSDGFSFYCLGRPDVEDPVNNPSHYTFAKYEVIDVLYDWQLQYPLDNVIKYVTRAGKKSKDKELEDFKKAQFYLDYHIARLEGETRSASEWAKDRKNGETNKSPSDLEE